MVVREVGYAVSVRVVDSVTDGPISSRPIGVLTDGRCRETLIFEAGHLIGGRGRPGWYDIEIIAEGYGVWAQVGIDVPGRSVRHFGSC